MADEIEVQPIRALARYRYRAAKPLVRRQYRSRTGPKCCNANCGSTRKKSRRQALSKRDAAAARG